jgi:hypothetical protein
MYTNGDDTWAIRLVIVAAMIGVICLIAIGMGTALSAPSGVEKCLISVGNIDECARIYKTDRAYVERANIELEYKKINNK